MASIVEDEQEQNKSGKPNVEKNNKTGDSVERKSSSQSPNSDWKPPKDDVLNPLSSIDECYAATTIHFGFSQKEKWELLCNEQRRYFTLHFPWILFRICMPVEDLPI